MSCPRPPFGCPVPPQVASKHAHNNHCREASLHARLWPLTFDHPQSASEQPEQRTANQHQTPANQARPWPKVHHPQIDLGLRIFLLSSHYGFTFRPSPVFHCLVRRFRFPSIVSILVSYSSFFLPQPFLALISAPFFLSSFHSFYRQSAFLFVCFIARVRRLCSAYEEFILHFFFAGSPPRR